MTAATIVDLLRNTFLTALWIGLPVLGAGFLAGVLMSLAQILTSIQDSSFSTVPRLAVFLGVLLVAMPWMLARLLTFTTALLGDLARFAH
jgi:flagellar biosynthetic protein FliQ